MDNHLSFATDLWDGFSLVAKKSDCGLQSCKDILAFYRKRAQIEEEYSKALVKLCISATSEKRMIFKGRGSNSLIAESPSVLHSWESVIAATERAAKIHAASAKKITETCAESVSSFIKDLEQKQKLYVSEGNKYTKEYEDICSALEKSKSNYFKLCTELETAEKLLEETKGDPKNKDANKLLQRVETAREKSKQSEKEYKEKIVQCNQVQEKYLKEQMPKVLTDLEKWETIRIRLIKSNMKKYITTCERVPEVLIESNKIMAEGLELLDEEADVQRFIEENKTYNEPPAAFEYEPYVHGSVTIESKKKFDIGDLTANIGSLARKATVVGSNMLSSPTNSSPTIYVTKEEKPIDTVFDLTLDQIMAKQKDKPELEIPEVLSTLTESIISLGGKTTEGIFRVPASTQQVQALKKQIIERNYKISDCTTDPHVPAAVLKLWLRGLPEPLVPNSLYESAMSCAEPNQAMALFNKLPPLNAKIVRHLMKFLGDLAHPDTVKVTKMNVDNLAMVFAPSLLRCPYEDPLQILARAKNEQQFTKSLLIAIAPPPESDIPPPKSQRDLIDFENDEPEEEIKSEDLFKNF